MLRKCILAAAACLAAALSVTAAVPAHASDTNTAEDNFTRADQAGWGTTVNNGGVPGVAWGMDGTASYVTISGGTGRFGYPGATSQRGIASAGPVTYNGGDALAELSLSAAGHGAPYLSLNACPDKSCYYGAWIDTTLNQVKLTKRLTGGSTTVEKSASFTAAAGTRYWIRLDYDSSAHVLSGKFWADGTAEPSGWTLQWTDSTSQLSAGFPGAGGTWPQAGTGEYFSYYCYAYSSSSSVPAQPCAAAPPAGAPSVTSFTPASGPAGASVTITGTGFTGATAVTFSGTSATAFTVTSDTSLSAVVPAGAATGPACVTTANGTGCSSGSFTVTASGYADAAHLIRGINLGEYTTTGQFTTDTTLQGIVASHHVQTLRLPLRDGWTDAQYTAMFTAAHNTGATPLAVVHGACQAGGQEAQDSHFLDLLEQVYPAGTYYVEYGNEEDFGCGHGPITVSQYVAGWNRDIPLLQAAHPRALFIGPVTHKFVQTWISYFLLNASPHPYALSWHWYPCSTTTDNATCLSRASTGDDADLVQAQGDMTAAGYAVPVFITEWNVDGVSTDSRFQDGSFMTQFMNDALAGFSTEFSAGKLAQAQVYDLEANGSYQLVTPGDTLTPAGTAFLAGI